MVLVNSPGIVAVDLFCGAGGLTSGLIQSGIDVKAGVDTDENCRYAYETNNDAEFITTSVSELGSSDLNGYFDPHNLKLLAGCAPCQTFSNYNRSANESDNRWRLVLEFLRLVEEISPELVTMENVPGLARQDVFQQFVKGLKKLGYFVSHSIVKCAEYGIGQSRSRLVLLASQLGPIQLPKPEEVISGSETVRSLIGALPPLEAGQQSDHDPLHIAAGLSPLNLRRIRASKPGGTWKDWNDEKLVSACHTRKSGSTYTGVYGRMEWDRPSPTMTTQFYGFGSGRFGHPEQDRAISLREGAILQGFPKGYRFVRPGQKIQISTIGRMIGNAVPAQLGKLIGTTLIKHAQKSMN